MNGSKVVATMSTARAFVLAGVASVFGAVGGAIATAAAFSAGAFASLLPPAPPPPRCPDPVVCAAPEPASAPALMPTPAPSAPPPEERASRVVRPLPSERGPFGALLVQPAGFVDLRHGGRPVSSHKPFPLRAPAGHFEVGGVDASLQTTVAYQLEGGVLRVRVDSEPWAIAYVEEASRGKVPAELTLEADRPVKVELKRPGMERTVELVLRYWPVEP